MRFSVFTLLLLFLSLPSISQDVNLNDENNFYQIVDQMPRFPGCEDIGLETENQKKGCAEKKMLEFIYKNIKYPAVARENGIEGMVVISFIVNRDGAISDAKILRDLGGGCGKEALQIIKSMPKWTPGEQNGEPVRVQFNLPVRFKLQEPAEPKNNINVPPPPFPNTKGLNIQWGMSQAISGDQKDIQHLFCADFAGELLTKEELAKIADEQTELKFLCGSAFKISALTLERSRGGAKKLTTKSDQLSEEMRDLLRNSRSGDAFLLIFSVENQGEPHEISKSIIVSF